MSPWAASIVELPLSVTLPASWKRSPAPLAWRTYPPSRIRLLIVSTPVVPTPLNSSPPLAPLALLMVSESPAKVKLGVVPPGLAVSSGVRMM